AFPVPAAEARRAAAPLAPAGPGPEHAPRTIEVSIGRIEVRATPAAEDAGKPRAAPPTMTLDEYLRRRAGGAAR
ncbi:MAG: hypothetical protein ACREOQ_07470, partial [Gemmatimonadales bacterium]